MGTFSSRCLASARFPSTIPGQQPRAAGSPQFDDDAQAELVVGAAGILLRYLVGAHGLRAHAPRAAAQVALRDPLPDVAREVHHAPVSYTHLRAHETPEHL